jgi:CubicO group peptidase (beta-lactamase class C family)
VGSPVVDVAAQLEAKAAAFVKEQRVPGASVGVVHGDALVWSAGVGFADVAARRPSEATTLYRIGSITKTFTGTAIMQLRDRGRLDLDDAAVTFIPELRDASSPFGPIETVTIRRMLSHESGLAGDPPGTDWALPSYEGDLNRNLARVSEMGTRISPSSQHKYSNLAYQLLGEIIARVSGVQYVEHVRREIIEPLDLQGTSFEPLPQPLLDRRATGYAFAYLTDELAVASVPPTVWAEGGLWSCLEDLGRWVSFQMGSKGSHLDTVLDASTLGEMHRPRYLADEAWTEAWGIAWYALRRDDVIWIQHGGSIHGFKANVCFDPKERVGAIALLNGDADASRLSMDLATVARAAVLTSVREIEPATPTPESCRPLLGIYVDPEAGSVILVEWRDGKLTVVDPTNPTWRPTFNSTQDRDVFVVDAGVRESGEPAVFHRLPDGRVASLFVAAQTWTRLDPVT